jgi:peptidoglycan/xylan/chitin deacetylase (PgdA/CDA1 family)
MTLDPQHLQYPLRRHGMDHDRYAWSMLTDRQAVTWPGGKRLALWVNVSLQHFGLNPAGKPVKLPGAMTMPYPDLRHYTLRDYGNRVGIYRFLDAFDRFGVRPSFAINACLVQQHRTLVQEVVRRGDEVLGHSWSMDTPHAGGLAQADEAQLIQRSLDTLRQATGKPVRGWLGPGRLQSENTPELLHAAGIEYFSDWVNDELPYRFHTARGDLWSLPLCNELDDRFVVMDNQHSEASWAQQVQDACELLLAESQEQGGRILSLSLHPWVLGQPHRIKHLEAALAFVTSQPGVWCAPPGEILDAFVAQQPQG